MNPKLIIILLLSAFASGAMSGCTSVEGQNQEEVVIGSSENKKGGDEVVITNSDLKKKEEVVTTAQEAVRLAKRLLGDGSEVETLVDGFGNKTESRYFPGHPRLRLVVLRTSADGKQEVTAYGYGSEAKILYDLSDRALTASGDEIANAAKLFSTTSTSSSFNYLKKRKTEPQPALQPLPGSQFQVPLTPVVQPVQPVETESENKTENAEKPQAQTKEDLEK